MAATRPKTAQSSCASAHVFHAQFLQSLDHLQARAVRVDQHLLGVESRHFIVQMVGHGLAQVLYGQRVVAGVGLPIVKAPEGMAVNVEIDNHSGDRSEI